MLTAVRLVSVERISPSYKKSYWEFLCDCGVTVVKDYAAVRLLRHPSCGCEPLTWSKMGRTPLPEGQASFNHLFGTYQRGAKRRGVEFDLTMEEFKSITSSDCRYCGYPPGRKHLANRKINSWYVYNGIDRVNNDLGYTVDNCAPCCKFCNYAKRTSSLEEFLAWLDRVRRNAVGA